MGAWIETINAPSKNIAVIVAPYVGAWIETEMQDWSDIDVQSHPTWVRGLKPYQRLLIMDKLPSHPTWVRGLKQDVNNFDGEWQDVAPYVGAWIETSLKEVYVEDSESHPTWVRGLKLGKKSIQYSYKKSHPTWVRGLKLIICVVDVGHLGRTLRGCVD